MTKINRVFLELLPSSGSKKETKGSHGPPPMREEIAIEKVPKLLLEDAKIIDFVFI